MYNRPADFLRLEKRTKSKQDRNSYGQKRESDVAYILRDVN